MKLYGKRFLKRDTEQKIAKRVETQDAMVWEIYPTQKRAFVRIQGSDKNIIAYYPENWEQTPFWLKRGGIVKINFTGGNRNRVELVGMGYLQPTWPGTSAAAPTLPTSTDVILTGCKIYPMPIERMSVWVSVGTFRIGVVYTLGPKTMGSSDSMTMGDLTIMGKVAAVIDIDAAPAAGYFRIDRLVLGADGTVDYVKGSDFTTTATIPAVPANHVSIGTILLSSSTTTISSANINKDFISPMPTTLQMEIADTELTWTTELTTTITVSVLDQYGNHYPGSYYVSCEMFTGNGTISNADGDSETAVKTPVYAYTSPASHAVFTYTRANLTTDLSPTIHCKMSSYPNLENYALITLLNEDGNPM